MCHVHNHTSLQDNRLGTQGTGRMVSIFEELACVLGIRPVDRWLVAQSRDNLLAPCPPLYVTYCVYSVCILAAIARQHSSSLIVFHSLKYPS